MNRIKTGYRFSSRVVKFLELPMQNGQKCGQNINMSCEFHNRVRLLPVYWGKDIYYTINGFHVLGVPLGILVDPPRAGRPSTETTVKERVDKARDIFLND